MDPDSYLLMSGIQHFCFCRRQWALIHLEQQWAENLRTAEGHLLHERCHDEALHEKRGGLLTVRGMRVVSHRLQLSGVCDVVEFRASPEGVPLQDYPGLWLPLPVEYKHGSPKANDADRLQLCAQAMALEEMLVCEIPRGALFYAETRRRGRSRRQLPLRQRVPAGQDLQRPLGAGARNARPPAARPCGEAENLVRPAGRSPSPRRRRYDHRRTARHRRRSGTALLQRF